MIPDGSVIAVNDGCWSQIESVLLLHPIFPFLSFLSLFLREWGCGRSTLSMNVLQSAWDDGAETESQPEVEQENENEDEQDKDNVIDPAHVGFIVKGPF
jgi:hypothetical protein